MKKAPKKSDRIRLKKKTLRVLAESETAKVAGGDMSGYPGCVIHHTTGPDEDDGN